MASVHTFGQLPEEEPLFLDYLASTGDIWARAVEDDAREPRFEPGPVAEFLDRTCGLNREILFCESLSRISGRCSLPWANSLRGSGRRETKPDDRR